MNVLNDFTSVLRRGVDDYRMIEAGDRVAVGVSGGKDSVALLCSLAHLRSFYPRKFELIAITLDLGFPDMDFSPVAELCAKLDVPYTLIKTDIREIVFDIRREENPCSLCAKMRRGALNNAIKEQGATRLALGHHSDDAIETFMLSLVYEGRISCFKPVTYMSRAGVWQIRPMIYVHEWQTVKLCRELGLPVVENSCPKDKDSKRREVKELLAGLKKDYPDIKSKIFGAMQRLPLDGWELPPRAKEM